MAPYKETVIEESRKRAGEVLGQIKHHRRQVENLEREYGQILSVLKALGAENAIGIQAEVTAKTIAWDDEVIVELPHGGEHKCSLKLMGEIIALKEFRTGEVVDLLAKATKYAGRDRGTLETYAGYYIAGLLKREAIVRMKRGRYAAVTKAPPTAAPVAEPRYRDDSGDSTEMHLVGGVVSCEKPEERGYGR